jgi:hypothetical protein
VGAREATQPSAHTRTHMYTSIDVEMQAPAMPDVTKVTNNDPRERKLPFHKTLLGLLVESVLITLIYYAFTGESYDPCKLEPIVTWNDIMKAVHWGQHTLEWAYAALDSEIQSVW